MKNILKKSSLILLCGLSLFAIISCSDEESCEYIEMEMEVPCTELPPNNPSSNKTVVTYFAANQGDFQVGYIYETQNNLSATAGSDWGATISKLAPSNWNTNDIGAVFGITIDDQENIYLASTDVYHYHNFSFPTSNGSRPYDAGQIFKCSPPLYTAVPFVNLPNFEDAGNGIGNIAYDKKHKQLFASNLENGMIYRISMSGAILETYDPWSADSGLVDGMVIQSERIWGIGVNYESGNAKVYFPRITTSNRELYSITLNPNGSFPAAGSEIVEISGLPGTQLSITDLAFSSSTRELLVSERGDPHQSTVHSFTRPGSSWNLNKFYFVGGTVGLDGHNAAGGVDFYSNSREGGGSNCDESFWASGNFMPFQQGGPSDRVYGIQGIKYSGNNSASAPFPTANKDTDLFIDFDQLYSWAFKGGVGDVEVFDSNDCYDLCL
jgi:hypothetical protein